MTENFSNHKIACMQPYLFPYLGYFQLINAVDDFVVLDDVGYFKKGWLHRNQILVNNQPFLFTIPLHKASQNRTIRQHEIQNNWSDKFLVTLRHAYSKSPYFENSWDFIKSLVLSTHEKNIAEAGLHILKQISVRLDLQSNFMLSSEIDTGDKTKQDRIIALCKSRNALTYINPIGGKEIGMYHKKDFYPIELKFIERKDSEGFYSIIHYLFTKSKDEIRNILNQYELID